MNFRLDELPSEIRVEIFTFLSIQHIGTLLSLNKKIHDELIDSSLFWRGLWRGYSKGIEYYAIPLDLSDSMKKQFIVLIAHKQQDIVECKKSIRKLQYELEDTEIMIEIELESNETAEEYQKRALEIKNQIAIDQARLKILITDIESVDEYLSDKLL